MKGALQLFSSESDEWETPLSLINALREEFGLFNLDPCASDYNPKAIKYFTLVDDGLKQDWSPYKKIFVNPPYSKVYDWVKKCYTEFYKRASGLIVLLVPARTDTKWFHEFIYNERKHDWYPNVSVRFIKGRLKFIGGAHAAPFPSMLVIWNDIVELKDIVE